MLLQKSLLLLLGATATSANNNNNNKLRALQTAAEDIGTTAEDALSGLTAEQIAAAAEGAGDALASLTPEQIAAGTAAAAGGAMDGAGGAMDAMAGISALAGCFMTGDPTPCCTPPADGSAMDPLNQFFCSAMNCVDMATFQIKADADPATCNCSGLSGDCAASSSSLAMIGMGDICTAIDGCCTAEGGSVDNDAFNTCMASSEATGAFGAILAGMNMGGGVTTDETTGEPPVPELYEGTEPVPELYEGTETAPEGGDATTTTTTEGETTETTTEETAETTEITDTTDETAETTETIEPPPASAETAPSSAAIMRPLVYASVAVASVLAMTL